MNPNILIVEDDASLRFMLNDHFSGQNWNIQCCEDGLEGLQTFQSNSIDLCLLDVMLPQIDGFTLAEQIRKLDQEVPIIFLTSKNMVEDRINGFRLGADDYVTKPFSIIELTYRIEALLKRSLSKGTSTPKSIIQLSKTSLDVNNLLLTVDQQEKKLTYKEAQLLKLLLSNPNQIVERSLILHQVWNEEGFFVARSMDVFISRLRKYLKADNTLLIENIRGVGYRLKKD